MEQKQEVPMDNKVCTKCGESKDETCFHVNPSNPDGRTYECKECISARNRARYTRRKAEFAAKRALKGEVK